MKKLKKHGASNLEFWGMLSGLLIIVCFAAMFLNVENSRFYMNVALGTGNFMNGAVAVKSFSAKRKSLGIFFAAAAGVLLLVLILRLFLVKR